MGILWIIGGAFAVGVYLFGVGVGLGIVKVGNGS
jgi:hypothetical protein